MLIYDGDCGFCTRSAKWIGSRLGDRHRVLPYQSLDIAEYGLTIDDVTNAAFWIDAHRTAHRGHLAIGRSLVAVGGFWGIVGRIIIHPPVSWIAKPVYGLIARNRSSLPGATDACKI